MNPGLCQRWRQRYFLKHTSWQDFLSFLAGALGGRDRGGIKLKRERQRERQRQRKRESMFLLFSLSLQAGLCPGTARSVGYDEDGTWKQLPCCAIFTRLLGAIRPPEPHLVSQSLQSVYSTLTHTHTQTHTNTEAWCGPGYSVVQISLEGVEEQLSRHGL